MDHQNVRAGGVAPRRGAAQPAPHEVVEELEVGSITRRAVRCLSAGGMSPRFRCVRIAVARESRDGESRVAMVPELVGKLTELGYEVAVEPGAGNHALISDEEYAEAGAVLDEAAFDGAALVVSVQPLDLGTAGRLPAGTATISFLPTQPSPTWSPPTATAG